MLHIHIHIHIHTYTYRNLHNATLTHYHCQHIHIESLITCIYYTLTWSTISGSLHHLKINVPSSSWLPFVLRLTRCTSLERLPHIFINHSDVSITQIETYSITNFNLLVITTQRDDLTIIDLGERIIYFTSLSIMYLSRLTLASRRHHSTCFNSRNTSNRLSTALPFTHSYFTKPLRIRQRGAPFITALQLNTLPGQGFKGSVAPLYVALTHWSYLKFFGDQYKEIRMT